MVIISLDGESTEFNFTNLLFYAGIEVQSHYSKKNEKQVAYRFGRGKAFTSGGKRFTPFIKSSASSVAKSQFLLLRMREVSRSFSATTFPIINPMRIMWHFQLDNFYTKKGKVNTRAGDLDNLTAGPLDCLIKSGIIKDDGLVVEMMMKKVEGPNMVSVWIYGS